MIQYETPNGFVELTHEFFSSLIGYTASSCYGVAGMAASSTAQGLISFFNQNDIKRGVKVKSIGGELYIDLHIIVTYGVNITEIVKSIIKKVRYTVEDITGLHVESVNVYIDGMKAD